MPTKIAENTWLPNTAFRSQAVAHTGTTGYDQEAAGSFGEPVPWIAVYMWRRTA